MSIANSTTAEVYSLSGVMENTLKAVLVYRSDSRNPALVTNTNAALASLKTILDTVVADAVASPG